MRKRNQTTPTINLWQGAFLVTGTCIGGGMLALPIQTARAGAIPSLFIFVLVALIMMFTSLCIGELCIRNREKVNIVSLARHYFGRGGALLAGLGYLFLFYVFVVAYLSAIEGLGHTLFHDSIPLLSFLLSVLVLFFVYKGSRWLGRVNQWLVYGLIITYLLLVSEIGNVNVPLLCRMELSALPLALPVTVNAFNYHLIVPSLVQGVNFNRKQFYLSVLLGVGLTFVVYALWDLLVLGNVPYEQLEKNPSVNAIAPLIEVVGKPFLIRTSGFFSFFAIVTSFLGVSLAFFDILTDAIRSYRFSRPRRLFIIVLLFITSFVIAFSDPSVFLRAVTKWAGLGISLLAGVLPMAMMLKEKKITAHRSSFMTRPCFLLVLLFFYYVLYTSL